MKIGVIIPSYRVSRQILTLLRRVGSEVDAIYVVDDCCPENSGELVRNQSKDSRVQVIFHSVNQGVGGALCTGYRAGLQDGCDILIKLDGDGQMDPALISDFVRPIVNGLADYTKGNRFFSLDYLNEMPWLRVFGNTGLSFLTKASSGYWNLMDPNNGYTAIHSAALSLLPLDKIDRGYFFESDMLFRLNTVRAVVREIPMRALYGEEQSSLKISRVLFEFPRKHLVRFLKRLFYNYLLRDFNLCSVQILMGILLCTFGSVYGAFNWYESARATVATATGTVMVAALPIILGFQLLLAATGFDVANVPTVPLQELMGRKDRKQDGPRKIAVGQSS